MTMAEERIVSFHYQGQYVTVMCEGIPGGPMWPKNAVVDDITIEMDLEMMAVAFKKANKDRSGS